MDSTDMIIYEENDNNNDNNNEIEQSNDILTITKTTTETHSVAVYQTNPSTGAQELQQVTEITEINRMINYVSSQFNQNDEYIQNLENELNEKEAELSYGQNEYKKQTKLLISLKEKLSYRFNIYDEIKKLHEKFKYFTLDPVASQHDYFSASVQQSKPSYMHIYTCMFIILHRFIPCIYCTCILLQTCIHTYAYHIYTYLIILCTLYAYVCTYLGQRLLEEYKQEIAYITQLITHRTTQLDQLGVTAASIETQLTAGRIELDQLKGVDEELTLVIEVCILLLLHVLVLCHVFRYSYTVYSIALVFHTHIYINEL